MINATSMSMNVMRLSSRPPHNVFNCIVISLPGSHLYNCNGPNDCQHAGAQFVSMSQCVTLSY